MQRPAIDTENGGRSPGGVDQACQAGCMPERALYVKKLRARREIEHQRNTEISPQSRRERAVVLLRPLFGRPSGQRGREHKIAIRQDRKSTRLNSSHVEISY